MKTNTTKFLGYIDKGKPSHQLESDNIDLY